MPPKKASPSTTTPATTTRATRGAAKAAAPEVVEAPVTKKTQTKAAAATKKAAVVVQTIVEEPVVEAPKSTATKKTTKKTITQPEPKPIIEKEAAPVEEAAPAKKVRKFGPTEEEIEQMKASIKTFLDSLPKEEVADFTKIRRNLGVTAFARDLKKIQKVGAIQGNVVHKEKKGDDKKGKDYENYVRMRAAPHKHGGVVYIGHLPKGFTEEAMKKFFKQFGEVKRIQLSRAKKTGEYRGWGFVEFSDKQVAAIVAESMDKYMMFGRTLECKYIPYDQLHPETFRNNFRDFKKIDFTRIHNDKLNQMKDDDRIEKMNVNTKRKLGKKASKAAAMGWSKDDVVVTIGQGEAEVQITQPNKKAKQVAAPVNDKKVQLPKEPVKATKATVAANKAAAAKVVEAQMVDSESEIEEPAPKKRGRPAKVQEEEQVKPKVAVKKVAAKKTK